MPELVIAADKFELLERVQEPVSPRQIIGP
jgi:hypothetical protein